METNPYWCLSYADRVQSAADVKKEADAGDIKAMLLMGHMYEHGEIYTNGIGSYTSHEELRRAIRVVVKRDEPMAKMYYQKVIERGHRDWYYDMALKRILKMNQENVDHQMYLKRKEKKEKELEAAKLTLKPIAADAKREDR